MLPENKIVIVKDVAANMICIFYNGHSYTLDKHSKNTLTGQSVGLLLNNKGVETNILCNSTTQYTYTMFDTIGDVEITDNLTLFTELEKML